jgi:hypothetical protein
MKGKLFIALGAGLGLGVLAGFLAGKAGGPAVAGRVAPAPAEAPRSVAAPFPTFSRAYTEVAEQWRRRESEAARGLDQEARFRRVLELSTRLPDDHLTPWGSPDQAEVKLRIKALVQPEDAIPFLRRLLGDPMLTGTRQGNQLRELLCERVAELGQTEVFEQMKAEYPWLLEQLDPEFLKVAARRDPFEPLRLIREMESERRPGLGTFYEQAARLDYHRAAREAGALKSPGTREVALGKVYGTVAVERGIVLALKECEGIREDGIRASVREEILRKMAWESPGSRQAVLDYLTAEGTAPELRETGLEKVLSTWRGKDPRAALEWLEAYLARMPGPRGRFEEGLWESSLVTWAAREPEAGLPRLREIRDDRARANAYQLAFEFIEPYHHAAALALSENIPPADLGRSRTKLVLRYAQEAPAKAAQYVGQAKIMNAPDGPELVENVVSVWVGEDPKAASQWLAGLPPGKGRDTGIRKLTITIDDSDPEAATLWSLEIGDPETRAYYLRNSIDHWKSSDLRAARRWLDSPAARARLEPRLREELLGETQERGESFSDTVPIVIGTP